MALFLPVVKMRSPPLRSARSDPGLRDIGRLEGQMSTEKGELVTEVQPHWSEHTHAAVTHEHAHYHVTHNFFERAGAFEHLGYQHSHSHAHGSEKHTHYPHKDFDAEHAGEAHEHQHPAGSSGSEQLQGAAGAAKNLPAAAKKAAPTAKKAAVAATGAASKATGSGKKAAAAKSPGSVSKRSTPMRPAGGAGDAGRGDGASADPGR